MAGRKDILGNLPVELAHKIMGYLAGEDLGVCSRVNKKWRELANCDLLWGKICKQDYPEEMQYDPKIKDGRRRGGWGDLGVLPTEVVLQILGYLSGADLTTCLQVSPPLRRLASSQHLWRRLVLTNYPQELELLPPGENPDYRRVYKMATQTLRNWERGKYRKFIVRDVEGLLYLKSWTVMVAVRYDLTLQVYGLGDPVGLIQSLPSPIPRLEFLYHSTELHQSEAGLVVAHIRWLFDASTAVYSLSDAGLCFVDLLTCATPGPGLSPIMVSVAAAPLETLDHRVLGLLDREESLVVRTEPGVLFWSVPGKRVTGFVPTACPATLHSNLLYVHLKSTLIAYDRTGKEVHRLEAKGLEKVSTVHLQSNKAVMVGSGRAGQEAEAEWLALTWELPSWRPLALLTGLHSDVLVSADGGAQMLAVRGRRVELRDARSGAILWGLDPEHTSPLLLTLLSPRHLVLALPHHSLRLLELPSGRCLFSHDLGSHTVELVNSRLFQMTDSQRKRKIFLFS